MFIVFTKKSFKYIIKYTYEICSQTYAFFVQVLVKKKI